MAHPVSVQAHVPSPDGERIEVRAGNHTLLLDQPCDNNGEDAGPTPVDLFVASVAACTAHYLRIACRRHGIDPTGLTADAVADPAADGPARIGRITVMCSLPAAPETLDEGLRERLLRTAHACYIARTLLQQPELTVDLRCGVQAH